MSHSGISSYRNGEYPIVNDTIVDTPPLRIAVVGAGLVGSAAIIALSKLPQVSLTAFERASVPREAGAWISLVPSGLSILNQLVDPAAIRRIVYRPEDNAVYVTRHWRSGEILLRRYSSPCYGPDYIQARTQRWPLLQTLLTEIPDGVIQYGQDVLGLVVQDNGVRIRFQNSISEPQDLVVAADGIYSKIRQQYLPSHTVEYKGAVAYRRNFPVKLVEDIPNLPNDSSAWRNDTDVVFLSRLGLDSYGIVIIRPETTEYASTLRWAKAIGLNGLQRLREIYKDWDPRIGSVLDILEDVDAYPLDSGPWMDDLTRDARIAFVGDAAHPTAGAYGAGATMGFGDTWALYRALQLTRVDPRAAHALPHTSGYDLTRALTIYNETRRHFLKRVEQQMLLDKRNASRIAASTDEREWIRKFQEQSLPNQWLTEHDVELEFQKTLGGEILWSAGSDVQTATNLL